MPRRSNLFQDVVGIVHRVLAGGATVTESAELVNRLTGSKREVDVVVEREVAGHAVVVSVEATKNGRRATVEWVERMIGKHRNLPTSKLVLVAEAGFTKQARGLAEREFAVAVEPIDLARGDFDEKISDAMGQVWPKLLSLTAEKVSLTVQDPASGHRTTLTDPEATLSVIYPDMREAGNLMDAVQGVLQSIAQREYDGWVRDVAEDTDGTFRVNAAPLAADQGDRTTPLGLKYEPDDGSAPAFHPIVDLQVDGTKHIRVRNVTLVRRRIAGVDARYGAYQVGDDEHTLVITTTPDGERATLRVRSGEADVPTDFELVDRMRASPEPGSGA